jgi:SAM-dependent methyltransferase
MKRCLVCSSTYSSADSICGVCGVKPDEKDGFLLFAPAFAYGGGGFKENYFAELAKLEEPHFWFRARNRLIIWALQKYCPQFNSFLEIGCGTGYVLSGIADEFPNRSLHGSEIFVAGLAFAAARQPAVNFVQVDARNIPFVNEFDVIGAFDVLEHIQEDDQVLTQMREALKPDGLILLTVPQHPWLWSPIDEYASHARRYSATEIHQKVRTAGFEILRSTSFVSILLPAMLVSRLVQRQGFAEDRDATAELRISHWLNHLFTKLLIA